LHKFFRGFWDLDISTNILNSIGLDANSHLQTFKTYTNEIFSKVVDELPSSSLVIS